ncbi:MAG: BatD family protein [Bacteroidales bacterium]|nr:BatD family protein [Bacteroidales bacterium]MDY2917598.1 BatD family protein [Muribaculaceae bacterium]
MNRISNKIKSLAAAALVFGAAQGAFAQAQDVPDMSVHASLDTAAVTMGDRTVLRVEVLKNMHEGVLVDLPRNDNPEQKVLTLGGAEVRDIAVDSTDVGNGRIQLNYNFTLQPFEPGMLSIAPLKYACKGDTAFSEVVTLKVEEPQIPKEMRDSLLINPMVGQVSIPARWYDFIPSWWPWVLLGLGLIALGVAVFILYKKNGPGLLPRKKVIPPYQLAMQQLDQLKRSKLAEKGQPKEYYTVLTDILRQYLEGRFQIYAREMTSTQILQAMKENNETNAFTDAIRPMLETADFVKFAKQTPLPDENVRSFTVVHSFVKDTRPVEEEQPAKGKGKGGAKALPKPRKRARK